MIRLSVNVNKIATLRNSRGGNIPDLIEMCRIILGAGAHGITVHPREDERHIRRSDVFVIRDFLKEYNSKSQHKVEFNMEGDLSPRFRDLVLEAVPDQVTTLVPVSPGEITSDHGFRLKTDLDSLKEFIPQFKEKKIRVSIFMETNLENLKDIKQTGTDRVEFYTGPFAEAYSENRGEESFLDYEKAALYVLDSGIEINAGHDLDTENLKLFRKLKGLKEVSIGHRLISSALVDGLETTVRAYLRTLGEDPSFS